MKALSKLNNVIVKFLEYLVGFLLFLSVVFITAQVFFRYVFTNPLDWTEQTSRYLFIWMMMLGVAVVFHRNSVMAFDMILHRMRDPLRYFIELLIILIVIFFTVYYAYHAYSLASQVVGRMTSGIQVPVTFMYGSMVVSNVLVLLVMIEKFLNHLIDGKARLHVGVKQK